MKRRGALTLAALPFLALTAGRAGAAALTRDFCVGVSPFCWAFSLTPDGACQQVSLKPASPGIALLSAKAGASLPDGWTVRLQDGRALASGSTPLKPGLELSSLFVVETDRVASSISPHGALPVKWELRQGADGKAAVFAFPPVLELPDAVSRGLVLATAKARSAVGPVEITVDNPTSEPLWLDVPPGAVLQADGQDWIVGLAAPYDMLQKQKTGRTIAAFPVKPPDAGAKPPHRISFTGRHHEKADLVTEIGLSVRNIQAEEREGAKRKRGDFEAYEPFDFWPVVVQWSFWLATSNPPRLVLLNLVDSLLKERAAAGDTQAGAIDPVAATQEVEAALPLVDAGRTRLHAETVPLPLLASRARFPRG